MALEEAMDSSVSAGEKSVSRIRAIAHLCRDKTEPSMGHPVVVRPDLDPPVHAGLIMAVTFYVTSMWLQTSDTL